LPNSTSPGNDWETAAEVVGIFVALLVIWYLGKLSRDKVSRIVSVFACAALVWCAIALARHARGRRELKCTQQKQSLQWFCD